jgi:hydrogenase/urease accessory protein HupE
MPSPHGILLRAALILALHPNSVSSSRILVDADGVRLDLRCQAATLLESIPLDRDGDSRLSEDELERGRADVERYVIEGYRLSAIEAGASPRRLSGKLEAARLVEGTAEGGRPAEPLVDLEFRFDPLPARARLEIEFALFRENNPWHRDHAEIVWFGEDPRSRLLWIEDPVWSFVPGSAGAGTFPQYVRMGCEHILTGYDHLAFLLALVVSARRWRSLLGLVTAFTLAHSVTLALAALGALRLPERPVEASIALSIAWVGIRGTAAAPPVRLWPEAFGFGLVHGLGFARVLADSLASSSQKLTGLVGFNLGIECGQLLVVAAIAILLAALPDRADSIAPTRVRRSVAAGVGGLGLYWLVVRILSA